MTEAPTFGVIEPYQPETESFTAYSERVLLFFEANNIEEGRRVPVLLSVIGTKLYSLLRDLLAPENPKDSSVADLLKRLKEHLEPAPIVIAERSQ